MCGFPSSSTNMAAMSQNLKPSLLDGLSHMCLTLRGSCHPAESLTALVMNSSLSTSISFCWHDSCFCVSADSCRTTAFLFFFCEHGPASPSELWAPDNAFPSKTTRAVSDTLSPSTCHCLPLIASSFLSSCLKLYHFWAEACFVLTARHSLAAMNRMTRARHDRGVCLTPLTLLSLGKHSLACVPSQRPIGQPFRNMW